MILQRTVSASLQLSASICVYLRHLRPADQKLQSDSKRSPLVPFRPLMGPFGGRRNTCGRLGRTDDGKDLELDDVSPSGDPFVEERSILALHDLVTSSQIRRHPA